MIRLTIRRLMRIGIGLLRCFPALLMFSTATGEERELAHDGPVLAPIQHEPLYRGERELFGYNPRFAPGTESFDGEGRPYILDKEAKEAQTLDEDG